MSRPLRKILCIDDDEDIAQVTQMTLEVVGGFEVALCSSGHAAIAGIAAIAPDLILLDAMMPELDGPATLAKLRTLPEAANIPVIFLTARVQAGEVREYTEMGAIGVLQKPFDPMQLADQIRAIWDRAHS